MYIFKAMEFNSVYFTHLIAFFCIFIFNVEMKTFGLKCNLTFFI